jgi:hypothetical protein
MQVLDCGCTVHEDGRKTRCPRHEAEVEKALITQERMDDFLKARADGSLDTSHWGRDE